jgi:hypothetical protein
MRATFFRPYHSDAPRLLSRIVRTDMPRYLNWLQVPKFPQSTNLGNMATGKPSDLPGVDCHR